MRKLWYSRRDKKSLTVWGIQQSPEYRQCALGRFKGWEFFLENTLQMLLDDLASFESMAQVKPYVVDQETGRIGYKDQDGISYKRLYRYTTMFAYFKESEGHYVDEKRLKESIFFIVNCGSFSYAEVPKLYDCVIGATGTLETLSKEQQHILQDVYGVQRNTFMPTVYTENQLEFQPQKTGDGSGFKVFRKSDFHQGICDEIKIRKDPNNDGVSARPVLVFFESSERLREFHNSHELGSIRNKVQIMTPELSREERNMKISAAVNVGSITLLTREYGRGIDFRPQDNVQIAVIQTFVRYARLLFLQPSTPLSHLVAVRFHHYSDTICYLALISSHASFHASCHPSYLIFSHTLSPLTPPHPHRCPMRPHLTLTVWRYPRRCRSRVGLRARASAGHTAWCCAKLTWKLSG